MDKILNGLQRYYLLIQGQVQGIGFRPFIYRLARRYYLAGSVKNTSPGVAIEVEGDRTAIAGFIGYLKKIGLHVAETLPKPFENQKVFSILDSETRAEKFFPLSSDRAICDSCLEELYQPENRRYLYPFISCPSCGPRYTVIENLPYDRPVTTMKIFSMCAACQKEYRNEQSHRMHSQLNSCLDCGPQVYLVWGKEKLVGQSALAKIIELLKEGKIAAVKGCGGFHLACDAANELAVKKLRRRKNRPDKPLAIIAPLEKIRNFVHCSAEEEKILSSPAHPIVLLEKKISGLSENISTNNGYLGVMLPYTPLQYLLFYGSADNYRSKEANFSALVMTSGNQQEEPICLDEKQALDNLGGIADCFLFHNYPIANRCDDSLVFLSALGEHSVRRSRGYVPETVASFTDHKITALGCGAELKNTFCLVKNGQAYLSPHIGVLTGPGNFDFYQQTLQKYFSLLDSSPQLVAYDLHPDYLSTRLAKEFLAKNPGSRGLAVQHHQAHIGSVLAEQQLAGLVIGVAFDGSGLGTDGCIWGGEFFLVNGRKFERLFHLDYFPLPGGDQAAKEIWRLVVSLFDQIGEKLPEELAANIFKNIAEERLVLVKKMLAQKINSPLSSSIGRLFDGVACLLGLNQEISYEAQAAGHLEFLAGRDLGEDPFADAYNFPVKEGIFDPSAVLLDIVEDLKKNERKERIARKFHFALIKMIVEVCQKIAEQNKVNQVALSGGVFQNRLLLEWTSKTLSAQGFKVYTNQRVPANDGGISLGQVWHAFQE